jgi:hypothetical protein
MNHQSAAGGQTQREALASKIVIGTSARGCCAPGAGPQLKANTRPASSSHVTCEAHQDDYGLTKKSTTTLSETL